jgi:hypothetical protein
MDTPETAEINENENNPQSTKTLVTLRETVGARLSQIGESIQERVINIFVEEEIEKRKKQVVGAYSEYDDLFKREKRLGKPDIVGYDNQGAPAQAYFSKQRLDELKKVRERMVKLEKAIEDAILKSNFEKLNSLGAALKGGNDADAGDQG